MNEYQNWLNRQGIDWHAAYGSKFGDWPPPFPYHIPDEIQGIDSQYHQTTWCVEEALNFMEASKDGPWCMSVNIFDPHPPFDPPQEYKDKLDPKDMPLPKYKEGELDSKPASQRDCYYRGSANGMLQPTSEMTDDEKRQVIRDYYAEIMLIDDQVGRLIDYLEETGQRSNTVIIFMSDHGELLGDHGMYWKGGFLYDALLHVPLIFSCPGLIQQGVKSNALVELVDIAPTLLELSELPATKVMQGKSFADILLGKKDPDYHKDSVYAEYYYSAGRLHQICATMYFDGHYKVIVHHNDELGELYDLQTDPNEYDNLWNVAECADLRNSMVLKCFNHAIECNIDRVLGNTGMF